MEQILKDVMQDACKKMQGQEIPDLIFFTILKMMEYRVLLRREGFLGLEWVLEEEGIPRELEELSAISSLDIFRLIPEGVSDEHLAEILATKYWANNPQGIDAMANYIGIRGYMAIREYMKKDQELSLRHMEILLTSCLPAGTEERYRAYRAKHFPQFEPEAPKSPKEQFMADHFEIQGSHYGYMATVKDKLEKRILKTPKKSLKPMINSLIRSDENRGWLEIAMKTLSNEAREKIFSCMTKEAEEELIDSILNMGPIRMQDVTDSITFLILELMEQENK